MTGKTIKLTKGNDNLKGGTEADIFNALATRKSKATLSDADVLNGRGGVDTVKAFIAADTLTPNLKNIETAIFTRTAANDLTLDLAKSARLDTITFDKFASGVSVINASSLATLAVNAMAAGKAINLAGIDATKVTNFSASLTGSNIDLSVVAKDAGKFATITLALDASSARFVAPLAIDTLTVTATGTSELKGSADWLSAKTLVAKGAGNLVADLGAAAALTGFDGSAATGDITLTLGGAALTSLKTGSGKDVVTISGKTSAGGALAVDLGAGDNVLKGSAADWLGAKTLTLTGAGKLTADLGNAAALTSLDASAMTGDLTVTLGGAAVTSLKTGAGKDVVKVTAANSVLTTVGLGAGDDVIDLSAVTDATDSAKHAFQGGLGYDKIILSGLDKGFKQAATGFEALELVNPDNYWDLAGTNLKSIKVTGAQSVTFELGKDDQLVTFDASLQTGSVDFSSGGKNLSDLKTGSGGDYVEVEELGGTAGQKVMIDLGAGDDQISFLSSLPNGAKQQINGGSGDDTLILNGAGKGLAFANAINGFEHLKIVDGSDIYNLSALTIKDFILVTTGGVTLSNLKDGDWVRFVSFADAGITLEKAGTTGQLNISHDFGNSFQNTIGMVTDGLSVSGFDKVALDNTGIANLPASNTIFVGNFGGVKTLSISGSQPVVLKAADNLAGAVEAISIAGNSSLDMSDLAGKSYFAASGVTIAGGAGDDKLATGGGVNKVTGGGGLDLVKLLANQGTDMLIFKAVTDSSFGAADTVEGFQTAININGTMTAIDAIDLTAFGLGTVSFAGNVADESAGVALLQNNSLKAYFNQATDQLVIDVDKSGDLSGADFAVTLTGLNTFTSASLLS